MDRFVRFRNGLPLAELEPLARLRTARLLPLNFASVSREQIFGSQPNPEGLICLQQCSREAQAYGFSLSGQSTAGDSNEDVVLPLRLGKDERASYRLLKNRPREVLLEWTTIDRPLSRTRAKQHSGDSRLATA
jgi:hypothetical protein